MKLKINGGVGKKELLEAFSGMLNSLEDIGVNEFKGVNLYLNPYVDGEKVIPMVNGLHANLEIKSRNTHIEVVMLENGETAIHYQTGIKGSEINIDGRMHVVSGLVLVSEKSINDEKNAQQEEYERLEALRKEGYLLHKAQEKKENEVAAVCIAEIMEKRGLSSDEFKRERSSTGWIKDPKAIEKYTNKKVNGKAFRISMKIKDSKEKKVYLFDINGSLIFESNHE